MRRAHMGQPCRACDELCTLQGQQQLAAAMLRASVELQRSRKGQPAAAVSCRPPIAQEAVPERTISLARQSSTHQAHALLSVGAAHPDAAAESSCAQYSAAQAAVPVKKMWSRVASARGTSAALAAIHSAAAPAAPALAPPAACS